MTIQEDMCVKKQTKQKTGIFPTHLHQWLHDNLTKPQWLISISAKMMLWKSYIYQQFITRNQILTNNFFHTQLPRIAGTYLAGRLETLYIYLHFFNLQTILITRVPISQSNMIYRIHFDWNAIFFTKSPLSI